MLATRVPDGTPLAQYRMGDYGCIAEEPERPATWYAWPPDWDGPLPATSPGIPILEVRFPHPVGAAIGYSISLDLGAARWRPLLVWLQRGEEPNPYWVDLVPQDERNDQGRR